jgi:hypothetical protein
MSSSSVPCSSVLSRCPYALLLDADDLLLGVSLLHNVNCFFSVGRGGNGVLQNKAWNLSLLRFLTEMATVKSCWRQAKHQLILQSVPPEWQWISIWPVSQIILFMTLWFTFSYCNWHSDLHFPTVTLLTNTVINFVHYYPSSTKCGSQQLLLLRTEWLPIYLILIYVTFLGECIQHKLKTYHYFHTLSFSKRFSALLLFLITMVF